MFSCDSDCSINRQTFSKVVSAVSLVTCLSVDVLRMLSTCPASRCPAGAETSQGDGKDQSKDDCGCKALRIANQDVLETGVKPSGNALQS